jgi:hypothetical protein
VNWARLELEYRTSMAHGFDAIQDLLFGKESTRGTIVRIIPNLVQTRRKLVRHLLIDQVVKNKKEVFPRANYLSCHPYSRQVRLLAQIGLIVDSLN